MLMVNVASSVGPAGKFVRLKSKAIGNRTWKLGSPNGSVEKVVRYDPSGFLLVGPHDEGIEGEKSTEYTTEDQVRKACVKGKRPGFYKAHGELNG